MEMGLFQIGWCKTADLKFVPSLEQKYLSLVPLLHTVLRAQ